MDAMIAFCGLDCTTCEAYLATQANDEAAKERVAARWRKEYNNSAIDAAYVTCDGCTDLQGRPGGHCLECDMRACGIEHQVANCAHCGEYEGCEKLARFFGFVPDAKTTLDGIRRTL
jgi:hypothetical protein